MADGRILSLGARSFSGFCAAALIAHTHCRAAAFLGGIRRGGEARARTRRGSTRLCISAEKSKCSRRDFGGFSYTARPGESGFWVNGLESAREFPAWLKAHRGRAKREGFESGRNGPCPENGTGLREVGRFAKWKDNSNGRKARRNGIERRLGHREIERENASFLFNRIRRLCENVNGKKLLSLPQRASANRQAEQAQGIKI